MRKQSKTIAELLFYEGFKEELLIGILEGEKR